MENGEKLDREGARAMKNGRRTRGTDKWFQRLKQRGVERELRVILPNYLKETGRVLRYAGSLTIYRDREHGILPTVTDKGGTVSVLDPRSIILESATDQVIYSPRKFPLHRHAPWCREWLEQHARWGMPGCEQDWNQALKEEAVQ
jgi:hypothetical protein